MKNFCKNSYRVDLSFRIFAENASRMKIVNPLYDKAFKYLMENEKFARKVLSVILDVDIDELTMGHQETMLPDEKRQLTFFRLDFKAVIKEADGTRKTVLIELQKSKFSTDIQRFRNYLGANYMAKQRKTPVVKESPAEYHTAYPIITIYILGYNLDDLPYMAVTVNRDIINSVSKEKIQVKSFFIEHLTHQSHIIQVRRLPDQRRTRLEKFLTLFNQAWCTEENYIIDLQDVPEEFADMAEYLQVPLMDDNFRRFLEAEEEIDTIFDAQEAKYQRKIAEALRREEKERNQKLKERNQKIKERKMREDQERIAESERVQKESLALKLAAHLKKSGIDPEKIAEETGLSPEVIAKL
jgi:hypothetical protein